MEQIADIERTATPTLASTGNGLPMRWAVVTVAEVCDVLPGYGFPESMQGNLVGEVPFFKVGDISEACKRGETKLRKAKHYISWEQAKQLRARALPEDTTVFAKIGAAIALNRRVMLDVPALVDNNVMGLHPRSEVIDPRFLFHFTCTLRLMDLAQATTVPSVRKSQIESILLPLPPLAEQLRIAAEIEKQFTRLEAAVAALKRVQANLKRYRASVLKAACEGRLVPTEAELARTAKSGCATYEPADQLLARILKDRRAKWEGDQLAKMRAAGKPLKDDKWKTKYKEPTAPDTANLPELPEGWAWTTVEQLSLVVRGASPRPAGDPRYFGGTIPWITVGALTADEQMYLRSVSETVTEKGRDASRYIEPDTLLLTNSGATLGVPKITLIGGCINDGSVALLFVPDPTKRYLYFFLKSQTRSLRAINQGAAQPNLNTGIVKQISVPVPPAAEQTRIVAEVERRLSVIDELEATVEADLKRAERLRQSILKRAFEGKLVPQDPNDEPASVLLERIRAERSQAAKGRAALKSLPTQLTLDSP